MRRILVAAAILVAPSIGHARAPSARELLARAPIEVRRLVGDRAAGVLVSDVIAGFPPSYVLFDRDGKHVASYSRIDRDYQLWTVIAGDTTWVFDDADGDGEPEDRTVERAGVKTYAHRRHGRWITDETRRYGDCDHGDHYRIVRRGKTTWDGCTVN